MESVISFILSTQDFLCVNLVTISEKDNLHIKDKKPAPNLSVIRKFYCTIHVNRFSTI